MYKRQDYIGKVCFDGNPIDTFDLTQWSVLRQTKISAVFQTLALFPDLTALENIMVKNDLTDHKTLDDIISMLTDLGMAAFKDQKTGDLSLGQQQRVAIIRSLCQPFEWLLLDEPFSHLDEDNIQKSITLMQREIRDNQAGVILTTLGPDYGLTDYQVLNL